MKYVTKPSLPPLEEYVEYLKNIWHSQRLTNGGDFHGDLEESLKDYLGVKHVSLFCNGTIALLTGLKAIEITKEVITTPYTFIATPHAISWNGATPVFCDIDPRDGNMDADKIEDLINDRTEAIMPVHVYGNPCNADKIQAVAQKNGLKVFYDGAHAFNVKEGGNSILNYGNLSILSFHATKIFNTAEGGALVTDDPELKKRIDMLKNFGIKNETEVIDVGINGKMNELQAALGLAQLKHIDGCIEECRTIVERYRQALSGMEGVDFFEEKPGVGYNYSYCPVLIRGGATPRDEIYTHLRSKNVFARRYFYPLCNEHECYNLQGGDAASRVPEAFKMSREILCLPVYAGLTMEEVDEIAKLVADKL